ncbi:hypothetical protein [Sporosarcina aquimarina]|uniref:Uncharacterized protein n=1 Tax=Sporosarcina aquimarina TaxID=114975 RepID=A0ABU4FZB1_9BACL|nr:hypothetical protein [Sporosarcina aquimarina]MDW0110060.1 hypothetical protein [Sporosarcina aquimarina]
MKKRNFISLLTAVFLFGLLQPNISYANSKDETKLKENPVQVSITNDQTGETTFLDPIVTEITKPFSVNSDKNSVDSENNSVEGYEVFIPLEFLNPSDIKPFVQEGKDKKENGVTAKIFVDYVLNASGTQIRLDSVWGSWTPDSMYVVTNRKVNAHSSTYWGYKLSKTPAYNTFFYNTGFNYNTRVLGDGGPRAWSSAKVHVTGMEGSTHTITVDFNFAN